MAMPPPPPPPAPLQQHVRLIAEVEEDGPGVAVLVCLPVVGTHVVALREGGEAHV